MGNKTTYKKAIIRKWWFWITIFVFALAAAYGVFYAKNLPKATKQSEIKAKSQSLVKSTNIKVADESDTSSEAPSKDGRKYSLDMFRKITIGMTYEQVKKILVDEGEKSQTEAKDSKKISYIWKNNDATNILVATQDNLVTEKAETFLQKRDANVTLDKFDKTSIGMDYEQVKAILGEGELTSQVKSDTEEADIYSWINIEGGTAECMFLNGKLFQKSKNNLK